MKKIVLGSTLSLLLVLAVLPFVTPASYIQTDDMILNLQEKNPADWSVVENGAFGQVTLSSIKSIPSNTIISQRARVSVWDLEPRTKYTLIYYGDEEHNDEWNHLTCLKTQRTSTQGYFKSGSVKLNWGDWIDDGIGQKLWIVKTDDIDCQNKRFIAWNPEEYLFEENTL